jgi:hypothetical protein
MREVVINTCYGGFSLSKEAIELYLKLKNITTYPTTEPWGSVMHWLDEEKTKYFYDRKLDRHDPILISVVKQLGDKANGSCADLEIVEVQGRYRIDEYDGRETLEEENSYEEWL